MKKRGESKNENDEHNRRKEEHAEQDYGLVFGMVQSPNDDMYQKRYQKYEQSENSYSVINCQRHYLRLIQNTRMIEVL